MTTKESQDRFLGPNKIIGVSIEPYKTPRGADIVKVLYESKDLPAGTLEVMPKKTFELLVTDVAKDWNWVRETREQAVLEELAGDLMEWDIQHEDIKHLVTTLAEKLYTSFDRALNFLWTKDDSAFIPGKDILAYKTVLEADRILKNADTREDTAE